MVFGKRGGFWVWFWIIVAFVLGGFGLYYLISYVTNVGNITRVGANSLGLLLV